VSAPMTPVFSMPLTASYAATVPPVAVLCVCLFCCELCQVACTAEYEWPFRDAIAPINLQRLIADMFFRVTHDRPGLSPVDTARLCARWCAVEIPECDWAPLVGMLHDIGRILMHSRCVFDVTRCKLCNYVVTADQLSCS
jgi:hypothetical protein